MKLLKRATTDIGTVVLHWILVVAFLATTLTGLRIGSDDPGLRWLAAFDIILPMENLWLIHLGSALILTATLAAYGAYMVRSRLLRRVEFGVIQWTNLFSGGHVRWTAAGTLAYWLLMLALLIEIVTGLLQFLGYGGSTLDWHILAAWICIAFPVVHLATHWLHGGGNQLLRILRPVRLVVPPPPPDFAVLLAKHLAQQEIDAGADAHPAEADNRRPLLWALASGLLTLALLFTIEPLTRQQLIAVRLEKMAAPRLDGDLSDPAWAKAPVTRVLTQHGANFGGTGESLVEIRVVHDGTTAYFAFTWADPTRSLKQLPLVKRTDGWHVAQTGHDRADEQTYFEDKFSVLIARPVLPLVGAAIHLALKPLGDNPPSLTGRGLHYTANGSSADVWQWHADHADIIDDGYFGAPAAATQKQLGGEARYKGGYTVERGAARYTDNFVLTRPRDYAQAVQPRRLPMQIAALTVSLGRIRNSPDLSEEEAAQWWLTPENSVPYSPEADAAIPDNTVIPGVIVLKPDSTGSGPVGAARWSAGHWTLTLARKLQPPTGTGVPLETGDMIWVAAFDHSETRHTRHIRPITLEVQDGDAP